MPPETPRATFIVIGYREQGQGGTRIAENARDRRDPVIGRSTPNPSKAQGFTSGFFSWSMPRIGSFRFLSGRIPDHGAITAIPRDHPILASTRLPWSATEADQEQTY